MECHPDNPVMSDPVTRRAATVRTVSLSARARRMSARNRGQDDHPAIMDWAAAQVVVTHHDQVPKQGGRSQCVCYWKARWILIQINWSIRRLASDGRCWQLAAGSRLRYLSTVGSMPARRVVPPWPPPLTGASHTPASWHKLQFLGPLAGHHNMVPAEHYIPFHTRAHRASC